jgi:hypothetical protein
MQQCKRTFHPAMLDEPDLTPVAVAQQIERAVRRARKQPLNVEIGGRGSLGLH